MEEWLTTLQRANAHQRATLERCYGRKDAQLEKGVKDVYQELALEQVYREYEEQKVGEIRSMIERVDESGGLKKEVFESYLGKIYKRSK